MSLNKSPLEKTATAKRVQSPKENVKSHLEKKSCNEQSYAHYGPRPAKVAG